MTDSADDALLAALRAAPRRYRMPALPGDAEAALAGGAAMAAAFAIEAARAGKEEGALPPPRVVEVFTRALAELIRQGLVPGEGDPAFQALVLRAQDPVVEDYVRLSAQASADRRAVRAAVNSLGHPGRLRGMAPGPLREALAALHGLGAAGAWIEVRQAITRMQQDFAAAEPALGAALQALLAAPALARLGRAAELEHLPGVRRYRALRAQHGPTAGSEAAAAHGRAAARTGDAAEHETVLLLRQVAARLDAHGRGPGAHRVVRSLRTPPAFPGDAAKAKDEWDAALLHGAPARIALLAEVKAAPAAATPDYARLRRGLARLAQADPGASYLFASADGEVLLCGDTLRALQPQGRGLPARVIYCCTGPPEAQPPWLSAASLAVLLAEPASLAFALALQAGAAPPPMELVPVWEALTTAPRLRATLHQYDTARAAREAMLHPGDLLEALEMQGG